MSRDHAAYVADMVDACARIVEYTAAMSSPALRADRKTFDAVVRNLEVLGEAAKHVTAEVRALAGAVAWRELAGMRDVLIHDYFGVDADIVCDVTFTKVPGLLVELRELLARLDGAV